jgi:DNA-binding NtrC family response regulator
MIAPPPAPPSTAEQAGARARKNRVLMIEDEANIRFGVRHYLERVGFEVAEAESCASGLSQLNENTFDAALLDFRLPDGDALSLMGKLKEVAPGMPVVVLTGHATIDLAVRAIKEGAENLLAKPVELAVVQVVLERAIEHARMRRQFAAKEARKQRLAATPFQGTSRAIRELEQMVERIASTDRPVLLQGETGTGKGILAAWIHAHSGRSAETMVDLNCAGFSPALLESELFGHERGAFTGAVAAKPGLLEIADRGTVFLDEISEMDPLVQPRLLKVLEEQTIRRVGDVRSRAVDFRLIAASHQDLAALAQEGRFRNDLYFRLSTLPLRVPPLRERVEDIPVLARHILEQLGADLGRAGLSLTGESVQLLQRYPWPGNVRELRNVLERAVLLNDGDRISAAHLRFDALPPAPEDEERLTLQAVEREHIRSVLERTGGRVDDAARLLGVPLSSLYQKLKRHGIQRPR